MPPTVYFTLTTPTGRSFGAFDTHAEAEAFWNPALPMGEVNVWAVLPSGDRINVERRPQYL